MSRWVEIEECSSVICGYCFEDKCLNMPGYPDGRKIERVEPDGFPSWCPGIDLDELRAKYQEALQHIGDEGECPLKIFDYDLELRYDINAFPCKEIRDGCPYNDEAWDLSYNGLVLSCWDKYFEMEVSNGVSEGECINTE